VLPKDLIALMMDKDTAGVITGKVATAAATIIEEIGVVKKKTLVTMGDVIKLDICGDALAVVHHITFYPNSNDTRCAHVPMGRSKPHCSHEFELQG
jgi:hypothetical protein